MPRPDWLSIVIIALALVLASRAQAATPATIAQVQGAGHASPLEGQVVRVTGIVTLATGSGFHLQDEAGDGDNATSDAIFVARRLPSGTGPGARVEVEGRVAEQRSRPTAPASELAITQIVDAVVRPQGMSPLPAPVTLGAGGRQPPTMVIDDDQLTSFDPEQDGLDFWESLEGMRVRIEDALVVGPSNSFREIWVVGDDGRHATGTNAAGGITIAPGDLNPERIQLQLVRGLVPDADLQLDVGDRIAEVTGVVSYAFGNYEVVVDSLGAVTRATSTPEPRTTLLKDAEHLVIAGYNVENLDPKVEDPALVADPGEIDDDIGSGKLAAIAAQIVTNLGAPDIVALQEVQDEDGSEMTDVVAAAGTLEQLVEAIEAQGGPRYAFVERPPLDDAEGGQPGGNIRVAFLFDPARVSVDEGRVQRLEGPAFASSRRPVAVPFRFNGMEVLVVNVHLTSRGGSDPLFGAVQPPSNGGEAERVAQAQAIRAFLAGLPPDPSRRLVVLGDFNAFQFELPLLLLAEGGTPALANLTMTLPLGERRSYVFEGNGQALDHVLVDAASAATATYDVLHLNSGRAAQTSDHDPPIVRLQIR